MIKYTVTLQDKPQSVYSALYFVFNMSYNKKMGKNKHKCGSNN